MGGAEEPAGETGHTGETQEAEAVGCGAESHKGSHQEALGGLPKSPGSGGVSPATHGKLRDELDRPALQPPSFLTRLRFDLPHPEDLRVPLLQLVELLDPPIQR
jgi:hypothetical protein